MMKRLFLIIVGLTFLMFLAGQQSVLAEQESKKGITKDPETLKPETNYVINLGIDTNSLKENILFVVAGRNFGWTEHFLNADLKFGGNLYLKSESFLITYGLKLREKIIDKEDGKEGKEFRWIDNNLEGSTILYEDQPITLFKTTNRTYTITISKLSKE